MFDLTPRSGIWRTQLEDWGNISNDDRGRQKSRETLLYIDA